MLFGRKKAKGPKLPQIASVIGQGTRVLGDIAFVGGLHIDGQVQGSVQAAEDQGFLVQSELSCIQGDVRVANAVLNGEVCGNVHVANRVELAPKARILGDVQYRYLEMAVGAFVKGQISHLDQSEQQPPPLVVEPEPEPESSAEPTTDAGPKG